MTRITVVCNVLRDTYRRGHAAAYTHKNVCALSALRSGQCERVLISFMIFLPTVWTDRNAQHSPPSKPTILRFFDWLAITCIHSLIRWKPNKKYSFISWPDKSNKVSTADEISLHYTHKRPSNCPKTANGKRWHNKTKQKTSTIGRKSAKLQRKAITRTRWIEIWCNIRSLLLLWLRFRSVLLNP